MIPIFSSTKHLQFILLLTALHSYPLCAQQVDSAEKTIEKTVVAAGWLQDWRGSATQWLNISGGRAEVTGYVSVDRRICFFKNHTFEVDVYREPADYSLINGMYPCRGRQDNEMSVFTGGWSVKKDSIYLFYKRESFYDYEKYGEYQALKNSGETTVFRPKPVGKCKLRRKETYLWQDGKACMAAAPHICFK